MKLFVPFLLLCFCCIHSVFSQPEQVINEDCDSRSAFLEYKSQDSIKAIYDPHLLFKMATKAKAAEKEDFAKVYFARIFQQTQFQDSLIFNQARVFWHFIFEDTRGLDTLDQKISRLSGPEHELLAVLDLVKADIGFRTRQIIQFDSIIPAAIEKIKDKYFYRNIIAVALQDLSRHYFDQSRIEESMEAGYQLQGFVNEHFADCDIIRAGMLITLGRRNYDAGSLDSAEYYFTRSLALVQKHHPDRMKSLAMAAINLAELKGEQGYNSEALNLLKALELNLKKDTTAAEELFPKVFNRIAGNYNDMGNHHKAIEYYRKSILATEHASPGKTINKLIAYSNIANEFIALKALGLAENYNQKALDIALELLGENHRFTAIILMKMGTIQYEKGDYKSCEKYFDQSLALRRKLYGDQHSSLGNIYLNYSFLYRDQKDVSKALDFLELAIENYESHFGKQHPNLAKAFIQKSINNFYGENYKQALTALEEAENALGYDGNFKTCADPLMFMEVMAYRATYQMIHFDKTGEGDLNKILSDFEFGREQFEYHIALTEDLSDLSEIASDYYGFFQNYVWALLVKAEKSGEPEYIVNAYEITNETKNLSLYESLNARSQLLFSDVPKNSREELRVLKSKIKSLDQNLGKLDLTDDINQHKLIDSLNVLQQKLSDLNQQIQSKFPAYNRLKNNKRDVDIKTLIPKIGSRQALVDYLVLDSLLISFVVYNGKIEARRIPIDPSFREVMHGFLNGLTHRNDEYLITNDALNPLLVPFKILPSDIKKVTIIPDKFLFSLPFEILNFNDQPLLQRFAISYANSASILKLQNEIEAENNRHVFSGFAPDYSGEIDTSESKIYAEMVRSGNWALPFAAEELTYISDLLDGKAFFGDEADKAQCLEALKSSKIVHLSMHAEANNETPLNSRFIFNTEDAEEAKNLLLYELYNVKASSNLVVLSACETGAGNFHGGEGVRSLGNGFFYAGIPSVVMSLWKVPDESTSKIMKHFYHFLKEGCTKSVALQKAKMHYLENTVANEQKHPYYWAGFIIYGNDDTIHLSTVSNRRWHLLALVGLGLLLVFSFKRFL